jgi:hypothetical protein
MGEYWKPVNLTKREYIHPHDVNAGLKLGEWNYPESPVMKLMAERWEPADSVIFVSDYDGLQLYRGELFGHSPTYDSLEDDGFKRIGPST